MMRLRKDASAGFTLLEILLALFIFSLVSLMLVRGLQTVVGAQERTENSAERLRTMQMVLLLISRDVEQAVARPILDSLGGEEPALIGSAQGFTFTHLGYAATEESKQSNLQRMAYYWSDNTLTRLTWQVLDQSPKSQAHTRVLLDNVTKAHFQYVDKKGNLNEKWPIEDMNQPLPRAIKMTLSIANWGTLTQVYLIATRPSNNDKKA